MVLRLLLNNIVQDIRQRGRKVYIYKSMSLYQYLGIGYNPIVDDDLLNHELNMVR